MRDLDFTYNRARTAAWHSGSEDRSPFLPAAAWTCRDWKICGDSDGAFNPFIPLDDGRLQSHSPRLPCPEGGGEMAEPWRACTAVSLFERGRQWVDRHLFNGAWYHQQIDVRDRSILERFLPSDPAGRNQATRYTVAMSLSNACRTRLANTLGRDGGAGVSWLKLGLTAGLAAEDPAYGDLCVATGGAVVEAGGAGAAAAGEVWGQEYWFRRLALDAVRRADWRRPPDPGAAGRDQGGAVMSDAGQPDPARAQRGRLGIGRRLYRSTGECHRPPAPYGRLYGMLAPSCSAAAFISSAPPASFHSSTSETLARRST